MGGWMWMMNQDGCERKWSRLLLAYFHSIFMEVLRKTRKISDLSASWRNLELRTSTMRTPLNMDVAGDEVQPLILGNNKGLNKGRSCSSVSNVSQTEQHRDITSNNLVATPNGCRCYDVMFRVSAGWVPWHMLLQPCAQQVPRIPTHILFGLKWSVVRISVGKRTPWRVSFHSVPIKKKCSRGTSE
jgi:hypothetical protein